MGRGKDVDFGKAPRAYQAYFAILLRTVGARIWSGCSWTSSLGETFNRLLWVGVLCKYESEIADVEGVSQRNTTWHNQEASGWQDSQ